MTADGAPARDRYIDFLRVVGVGVVVFGHRAAFMVSWASDTSPGINALSWTPAL